MFRLKEVLKEKKMTANELAQRVGVTPVVVSRYVSGISSPRLDFMEKVAEILDIDVVELIREPDGATRRKSKEERQHDTYCKLLTYCKYYHGEIGTPLKMAKDPQAQAMRKAEVSRIEDWDLYQYDTGDNALRDEFYLRVASVFNQDGQHYYEYMTAYFADEPKLLEKMLDIFGRPKEIGKK